MPFDDLFGAANTLALCCWVLLVFGPRRPWLWLALHAVAIGGLCLLYAVLMSVYFFRVPGAGFDSLATVQRLFTAPGVALAGWLHYLAFDLLVGAWIARRADAIDLSRWLQAPLLVVTFMAGPVGLLLFATVLGALRLRTRAGQHAW